MNPRRACKGVGYPGPGRGTASSAQVAGACGFTAPADTPLQPGFFCGCHACVQARERFLSAARSGGEGITGLRGALATEAREVHAVNGRHSCFEIGWHRVSLRRAKQGNQRKTFPVRRARITLRRPVCILLHAAPVFLSPCRACPGAANDPCRGAFPRKGCSSEQRHARGHRAARNAGRVPADCCQQTGG